MLVSFKPGNVIFLNHNTRKLNYTFTLECAIPKYDRNSKKYVYNSIIVNVKEREPMLVIGCMHSRNIKWINVMMPDGTFGWESENYWNTVCNLYKCIII